MQELDTSNNIHLSARADIYAWKKNVALSVPIYVPTKLESELAAMLAASAIETIKKRNEDYSVIPFDSLRANPKSSEHLITHLAAKSQDSQGS